MQTEKRWISRRLVLEQKTNHWEIHPPPAGSFRRLCVERAQGHTPFNGGWPGWHALSSFLSQLSGLCTLGAFLLGTPHSTRQEKLAPEQTEARTPPGLSETRASSLSHMLTKWKCHSSTFSRALLLVFQGHLHWRVLNTFFSLTLIFTPFFHTTVTLSLYTISHAWAL